MSEHSALPAAPEAVTAPLVVEYAVRQGRNRAATASLVWGLLLFVPFVSGMFAIRFGRRGLRNAPELEGEGRGRARVGVVLGWVNLALSVALTVLLPPALLQARRKAEMLRCASQLRQIGVASMIYATTSKGRMASSFDELVSAPLLPTSVFVCPGVANHAGRPNGTAAFGPCSYVYVPSALPLNRLPNPAFVVLAYEPLTNHAGLGSNVAFVDGHVAFYPAATARKLIAELTAGRNPPPSVMPSNLTVTPATAPNTVAPATTFVQATAPGG